MYFLASLKKLENIRIKLDIEIRIELNRGDSDPSWKRDGHRTYRYNRNTLDTQIEDI